VNGTYEFIIYLNRIKAAYDRFKTTIWVLNTVIISIFVYAIFLLLGLPAFMKYYWQDLALLAYSPVILSLILGVLGATIIRKKNRSDIFGLLEPELSERAKTACDNRDAQSIPMQRLAEELRAPLSKIKPSEILKWKQINIRAAMAVVLAGATVFLAQSQISADITPSDFQSLADLRDRAMDLFQNDTQSEPVQPNLSGNIYGKPSLAVLNEEKLELMLYPGTGAGSQARGSQTLDRLFQQSSAEDVTAVPSELYIESLPPQNKEIVKRYFEILAEC
jgi:hypothetical protein